MTKSYWESFYKKAKVDKPSDFALRIAPIVKGQLVDLGCGNGRDVEFFLEQEIQAWGVDEAFESESIMKSDISKYMKEKQSPQHVYTRFFWHAIPRKKQLEVLDWVSEYLYIEARTTEDKHMYHKFKDHKRYYVSVPQLVKDLKDYGFQILKLEEGVNFAKYGEENPHVVRVVARKI